jgi:hypothetical protein
MARVGYRCVCGRSRKLDLGPDDRRADCYIQWQVAVFHESALDEPWKTATGEDLVSLLADCAANPRIGRQGQ